MDEITLNKTDESSVNLTFEKVWAALMETMFSANLYKKFNKLGYST